MTSPSEATTSEVLCTLLYHYCILWGMGRRGTGVTIRPTLPRFVLSLVSLLQQATKSQSWFKGKQHLFYLSHVFGFAKEMISCRHPVQTFFSRCSKMTVTMSIIYLSSHKCKGLWWRGCMLSQTSSRHKMVPVCRMARARQAGGKANSENWEEKRGATVMENPDYGV